MRFGRVRRSSLVISLVATAGVIFLGVLQGIVVAIVLAILLFFRRNWWPHGTELGEVPDVGGWHSLSMYPDARTATGIVVYRWEAPLFFANAGQFRNQIRSIVGHRAPAFIVVQCEAITDIDVTAAEVLGGLDEELNEAGIHLAFVELRDRLRTLITSYGLESTLDREHFYPSVDAAVRSLSSELAGSGGSRSDGDGDAHAEERGDGDHADADRDEGR